MDKDTNTPDQIQERISQLASSLQTSLKEAPQRIDAVSEDYVLYSICQHPCPKEFHSRYLNICGSLW